jgi:hypothetical protein
MLMDIAGHKGKTENPEKQDPAPTVVTHKPQNRTKRVVGFSCALIVIELAALAGIVYWSGHHSKAKPAPVQAVVTKPKTTAPKAPGLVLDTNKKYGNKYKNGLLPVGDGMYNTNKAKVGYIDACAPYAKNLTSDTGGGAEARGPWFTNYNKQYDINKKAHVLGSVTWTAKFSNTVNGEVRAISTNGFPNHTTGTFPIASNDPAYVYDRNPNSIKTQDLTYGLNANPAYNATPTCMGGQSGVMLTGVPLFNAFDAGGRDAGAWEVQDDCGGHPEKNGEYHYHTLSSCIKNISIHNVIGYALDGFPITGPSIAEGNILTTSDLDECHGLTSQYMIDGKTVTGYHYVMTQDFPYSVSCFRGKAIDPPGLQAGAPKP